MTDSPPTEIVISVAPMTLQELVAIADGGRVRIAADAEARIAESRRVVDSAMGGEALIYGLNTMVGHGRDVRVAPDAIRALQPRLVAMHAGAMGDRLPREVVRAAIAARINGIARGGSGASPAVAMMLAAMLNAGIDPIVPAIGSVGAGDLGQHAIIALAALGVGDVEVNGRRYTAAEALGAAGLHPLILEPKDGLSIISASGVTVGHAALVLRAARELLRAADHVAATSMDAMGANPSVVEAAVMAAKGLAGQTESGDRMRHQLEGSARTAAATSIQDPLSFRVIPQVHGAAREVLGTSETAVATELNALADNPLASIAADRMISNGNFHPMLVALTMDALRPAFAHVGQLSERRLDRIWNTVISGMQSGGPPPNIAASPAWAAGLALRYPVAARATRLRQLAAPVTLDIAPLDLGHEDHATNAPEAVARTAEALEVLRDVLAVELLAAYGRLTLAPSPAPGSGTRAMLAALAEVLRPLEGHTVAEIERSVADALVSLPGV